VEAGNLVEQNIAHDASAIGRLFKALRICCQIQILLDSDDMHEAFHGCARMIRKHFGPMEYTTVVQSKIMFRKVRQKGITLGVRKFDDEANGKLIQMLMIAILEADETMQHAVSERDNPAAFLAYEISGRETARTSKGIQGRIRMVVY
jgi:hypothetical protein